MSNDQHHRFILFILAALVLIPTHRFLKIKNLVRHSRMTASCVCAGQCGSNCGWNQGGACEECQANLFNNIQAGRSAHNYETFLSVRVADPDPNVFGPPGSGSTSLRYGAKEETPSRQRKRLASVPDP